MGRLLRWNDFRARPHSRSVRYRQVNPPVGAASGHRSGCQELDSPAPAGCPAAPNALWLYIIYLDNNATTQPSPNVCTAVADALTTHWENPSSVHRAGQAVRRRLELAREHVARLLCVKSREVIFTSGGTESVDLAIRGTLDTFSGTPTLITTRVEHAAVRDLAEAFEKSGRCTVVWLPLHTDAARQGVVDIDATRSVIEEVKGPALLSVQWANNETGVIQPIEQLHALCSPRGIVVHCDATQWVGKMPLIADGPFDLLTCSPHKFHGPKGVGVLVAKRGVRMRPTLHVTQELGRRGGTENVPGIIGAGEAADEAIVFVADAAQRDALRTLRDEFEHLILAGIPDAVINGPLAPSLRLWNTSNIGFPQLEAEALLLLLSERGVCASAGAACSSGSLEPSPVLLAMGIEPRIAHGSLRFSLSKHTTRDEVHDAARILTECVARLQQSMP